MNGQFENEFGDVVARLSAMPSRRVDEKFTARVMAALAAEEHGWRRLWRSVAVPVAAGIVAMFAAASIFFRPVPKPAPFAPSAGLLEVRISEYRPSDWYRPLDIASLAEPTATCLLEEAEARMAGEPFPGAGEPASPSLARHLR